ncbi:contactin-6 isoform X2 [Nematostella vectensis]|nr:contactin-6 isoform X2 [Nematostella vectensis]
MVVGTFIGTSAVTKTCPPNVPPLNLNGTSINSTALRITWSPTNCSGHIYGVEIQTKVEYQLKMTQCTTEFIFAGLRPNTKYRLKLFLYSPDGEIKISDGPSINVTTIDGVPTVSPNGVIAKVLNSTAIELSWNRIQADQMNGKHLGYEVYYKQCHSSTPLIQYIPHVDDDLRLSANVSGLRPYTCYSIGVAGRTRSGTGPTSGPFRATTELSVPGVYPPSLSVYNTSSTSLIAHWAAVPLAQHHGPGVHYKIMWRHMMTNMTGVMVTGANCPLQANITKL